jgi:hypothetical protein
LFCLQDEDVEFPADPETALGLVQLAMNCTSAESASDTAEAVAGYTPEELAPADARRLLVTAALRGHVDAVMALIRTSAVQVHVDLPTFEQVLQHFIAAGEVFTAAGLLDSEVLWVLYPVVEQLSRASALKLLQQAVARGDLTGA